MKKLKRYIPVCLPQCVYSKNVQQKRFAGPLDFRVLS